MNNITYSFSAIPEVKQIIELYRNCGLPRPVDDEERIATMFQNSNLIITAWCDESLIGISRSITDWAWSCYLADLAVHEKYKKMGIGKKLIELTKEKVGNESMLLLLAVPTAMEYYPKVGFSKSENSFIIDRED